MPLKCECGGEAEYLIRESDGLIIPVCGSCLAQYIHMYGEASLDYVALTPIEEVLKWVVEEVNKTISSYKKRLEQALSKKHKD